VKYQVELLPGAERGLESADHPMRRRLSSTIDALGSQPRPSAAKALQGGEGTLRVGVGAWRILYRVNNRQLLVLVVRVAKRSEAYR
jgi:mRNA interferase RelE/StbE